MCRSLLWTVWSLSVVQERLAQQSFCVIIYMYMCNYLPAPLPPTPWYDLNVNSAWPIIWLHFDAQPNYVQPVKQHGSTRFYFENQQAVSSGQWAGLGVIECYGGAAVSFCSYRWPFNGIQRDLQQTSGSDITNLKAHLQPCPIAILIDFYYYLLFYFF